MPFEKFNIVHDIHNRKTKTPHVTFYRGGSVAFHRWVLDKYPELANKWGVSLYIDRDSQQVGFDFHTNADRADALPVRIYHKTGRTISIQTLLKSFNYSSIKIQKVELKHDSATNYYLVTVPFLFRKVA